MLATVLAGGETSRLYQTLVRDLRLAKDVAADNDTKEIAGLLTLRATAAEGKTTADIESEFQKEIARLRAEPPRPAELARVLARLETELYTRLTRATGRAIAISTGFAQKDDPEYYRKEFARYFKVTPADIQRVASRYLTDDKVALLVRPVKPGEAKTELAPAGPDPDSARKAKVSTRPPAAGLDWSKMPGPTMPQGFQPPRDVSPVALQRDRTLDLNLDDVASGPGVAHGPDWYRRRS